MIDPRIQAWLDAPHSAGSERRAASARLPRLLYPAKRKATQPKGHAQPPGSGPAGETCGTCAAYSRINDGTAGTFRKCGKAQHKWTHGPGSDIRKRDAACTEWEKKA